MKPGHRVAASIEFTDSLLAGYEDHIRVLTKLDPPTDAPLVVRSLEMTGVRFELDFASAIDFAAERKRRRWSVNAL